MKSTGIVRKIDSLGRLVIPREIIKSHNLKLAQKYEDGSPMEFLKGKNGEIIIREYNPGCYCCDNVGELVEIMGVKLCYKCLEDFNNAREFIEKCKEFYK